MEQILVGYCYCSTTQIGWPTNLRQSIFFLFFVIIYFFLKQGLVQGGPLGPHPIAVYRLLPSSIPHWYVMDDSALGSLEAVVADDVQRICHMGELLDFKVQINVNKCDLVWRPDFLPSSPSLRHFRLVDLEKTWLVGEPLSTGMVVDGTLDRCSSDFSLYQVMRCFRALERMFHLRCLDHPALRSFPSLFRTR